MKRTYSAPDYEVVIFETDDVITTSSTVPGGSSGGAFDDGWMD